MSGATLLKHPLAYMTTATEGPGAMSNFMGFPPAPIFGPPQYFGARGRPGEPISPFFVPTNQTYMLPEFSGYAGQYGNAPFSETKPVVCEQQEIAVNALLSLKSTGSSSSTCPSTPTTMSATSVRTFGDETTPELLSALRMSTGAYTPGDSIQNFDVTKTSSSCMMDSQYPQDVKPIIPVPNYCNGSPPDVSTASITSPVGTLVDRSPGAKPHRKSSNKSGNNICQICGKSYARPSTLKTHMRTHSGEKPYRCDVCGKAFTQAANLTAHMRTHSGEKPFSCPICHKRFSQSSSVTTHLRTHSGERPYRCDYCGKAFADTSTLTKHKRIHSGEKPYRCKICNLGFSQSGNLHRHMKTHNN